MVMMVEHFSKLEWTNAIVGQNSENIVCFLGSNIALVWGIHLSVHGSRLGVFERVSSIVWTSLDRPSQHII